MKKIIQFSIFLLITQYSFGQSVTITPNQTTNSSNSSADNIVIKSTQATAGVYGYRHNGTLAAPTVVTSGQDLFKYSGGGSWGGGFESGGSLRFTSTENWGATNGAKASIWTVPNGSIGQVERMTINHDGKVGIGTTNPTKSGLIVNTKVGNSHAIFGDNTSGVSIESNYPGIHFNSHYDGVSRKVLSTGYTSGAEMDPATGTYLIYSSPASTVAGNTAAVFTRMVVDKDGEVGIGNPNPAAKLHISHDAVLSPTIHLQSTTASSSFIRATSTAVGSEWENHFLNSATAGTNLVYWQNNVANKTPLMLTGSGDAIIERNLSVGYVPFGSADPNSKLDVAGFTKLGGSSAPAIKMKKLVGTTNAAQGGNVSIAHGITDHSKILSIQVLVRYNGANTHAWVGNGYTGSAGYEFSYQYDGGNIFIVNTSGNSANILTKDIKIIVTYEE